MRRPPPADRRTASRRPPPRGRGPRAPRRRRGAPPPAGSPRAPGRRVRRAGRAAEAGRRRPAPLPGAGSDPVSVEHAVDVAQARDRLLEALRVGDLDDEPVLDHRRRHDAARLDDVDAALGERPAQVLEQPMAVPGVDLQLHLEGRLVVALPVDAHEALRVLAQRLGVRAVVAVDGDAAAERDVADDRVARDRATALGQADENVLHPVDADAVVPGLPGRLAARAPGGDQGLDRVGLLLGRLALLEALHDLVDDDLRGDLRAAQRDVEVVGLAEAHLADDVGQQRRRDDLLRRQALLLEVLLAQLTAVVRGALARLALKNLFVFVAPPRRLAGGEPVPRRP